MKVTIYFMDQDDEILEKFGMFVRDTESNRPLVEVALPNPSKRQPKYVGIKQGKGYHAEEVPNGAESFKAFFYPLEESGGEWNVKEINFN